MTTVRLFDLRQKDPPSGPSEQTMEEEIDIPLEELKALPSQHPEVELKYDRLVPRTKYTGSQSFWALTASCYDQIYYPPTNTLKRHSLGIVSKYICFPQHWLNRKLLNAINTHLFNYNFNSSSQVTIQYLTSEAIGLCYVECVQIPFWVVACIPCTAAWTIDKCYQNALSPLTYTPELSVIAWFSAPDIRMIEQRIQFNLDFENFRDLIDLSNTNEVSRDLIALIGKTDAARLAVRYPYENVTIEQRKTISYLFMGT